MPNDDAAGLDALLGELQAEGRLQGYAARAAAAELVSSWKAALNDGQSLAELAGDVDEVTALLARFKDSALAIAARGPAGPRR